MQHLEFHGRVVRVQVKRKRGRFHAFDEVGQRCTQTLAAYGERAGADDMDEWDAGRPLPPLF
jgi:hypothetical protein